MRLTYTLVGKPWHEEHVPRRQRMALGAASLLGATILVLGSSALAGAPTMSAKEDPAAFLEAVAVATYGKVLGNSKGFSLYALSTEHGAKLVCAATCEKVWPPLLVNSTVKAVSIGACVRGKIAFVTRSATTKQVTFNSYPLYRFIEDTGAGQSHGEGVNAFGGVWHLVFPAAATPAATLVAVKTPSTTTITVPTGETVVPTVVRDTIAKAADILYAADLYIARGVCVGIRPQLLTGSAWVVAETPPAGTRVREHTYVVLNFVGLPTDHSMWSCAPTPSPDP